MGDAQVFIRTAAFNFDVAGFFTKWQNDLDDAQTPSGQWPHVTPSVLRDGKTGEPLDGGAAWAEAGIICPWAIYLCYGDTRLLADHYDSFRRFVAFLRGPRWIRSVRTP